MKARILVADGDERIRSDLKVLLSAEGCAVDLVSDGISAIKHFRRYDYDLAIIDILLPELDGQNVGRQLRKIADTPYVFLSPDSDEESILQAYANGAEDCVIKPFSGKQLLARLRVILRRTLGREKLSARNLAFEGLYIDTVSRIVYVEEKQLILTPKEYQLLVLLAKNPNQAFSREAILNEIWGQDYFGTDRTVDTHIKTLREAIKPYHYYITTVRGFGYMFNEFKEASK